MALQSIPNFQLLLPLFLYLVLLSTIPPVAYAECPLFESNCTVAIEENTVCILEAQIPPLKRLEVRGTLIVPKLAPLVELSVEDLVVFSTGKLIGEGRGNLPEDDPGAGSINGSGGNFYTDLFQFLL